MADMTILSPAEIAQLDIDVGLLHEANRDLFHPLGMELSVEDDKLVLKRGNPEDTFHNVLDRDKVMKFRRWSMELHNRRSANLRFLIQVNSMTRQTNIEEQATAGDLPKAK